MLGPAETDSHSVGRPHAHTIQLAAKHKQDWLRIIASKVGTADPLAAAEECVANGQRDCAQAYPPLFQRRPKQSSQTQARPKTCVRVPLCVTECLIAAALHDLNRRIARHRNAEMKHSELSIYMTQEETKQVETM